MNKREENVFMQIAQKLGLSIVEAKCCRIVMQKMDEIVQASIDWTSGGIMQTTMQDNMFLSLYLSLAIQAAAR